MEKVVSDFKLFFKTAQCKIDSFIFRLHYRFTLVVLVAFSIAVTGRQYIGDPIDCISRDDIPNELLDTYCWVTTTFSVEHAWHKPVGKEIPYPGVDKHIDGEKKIYHAYYQWVCFVLFLQAMMFYVPRYIWKNVEGKKIQNLVMEFYNPVVSAEKDKKCEEKTDEMTNRDKAEVLIDYLKESRGTHYFYGGMYYTVYLMNFVNVLGQIFLVDVFLGGEFTTYGTKVLQFTEWDYTLRYDPMIRVFPRMTKCTFYRYGSSGDVQKHDAMCLIPINILNEKIYIFLWFWFVILTVASGVELLLKLGTLFLPPFRFYYLKYFSSVNSNDLDVVNTCIDPCDWVVLRLLGKNMSSCNFNIVMRDLALKLKPEYNEKKQKEKGILAMQPLDESLTAEEEKKLLEKGL